VKQTKYVFAKNDIKKYYQLKEKLPSFKEIVAQEVRKKKPIQAQKIVESTNLKPITVYKSLERLKDDKRVKVVKTEKIPTTPPKQDELFVVKYYAPTKAPKKEI
jgi:hypothetical protein